MSEERGKKVPGRGGEPRDISEKWGNVPGDVSIFQPLRTAGWGKIKKDQNGGGTIAANGVVPIKVNSYGQGRQ